MKKLVLFFTILIPCLCCKKKPEPKPTNYPVIVLSVCLSVCLLVMFMCGCCCVHRYCKQKKTAGVKKEEAVDANPYYGEEMEDDIYRETKVVDSNDYYDN